MKRTKIMMLLIILIGMPISIEAQLIVKIGDLYYNLSGTSASVANYTVGTDESGYTNDSYIIPSKVLYEDLEYTVNALDKLAFASRIRYYDARNLGSTASSIVIPKTVKTIGDYCFSRCENLVSITIPDSVISFGATPFLKCYKLREMIYLPIKAPSGWTATSITYVPDQQSYSSPTYSINDAHVIEMITFEKNEFEYTGQTPTTTWTNNVQGYTASLSMPSLNGNVGNHEEWIPVTFTKGDESFTAKVVYRYTVKPARLTAKANNISRKYGEENPQFSISYSGFVTGENESVLTTQPTISTTATKKSNVGDYPITISGGVVQNYKFVYEPGVLTIAKAPLSAKVNDTTKVYGSQNPSFTIEYSGLKNNEITPAWTTKPSFQTDVTKSSGVGKYDVKAINGVPINYDLGEITTGTLTVTPAPLTIKANDATRQYYSEDPNFGYTCNGFVNGENENVLSSKPTLSTSASKTSSVGTYPIKASGVSNSNYSISYVDGTLTITPRTLYASVGNYERLYNEDNPEFKVKYDGFVGNENENVLITKATASTTATKTSDVGSYPINVTGGSADNYKFSYTSGMLTINKAEQTISWDQNLNSLKVGDQVELKAEASSGLPITYTMDNNNAAEIYSAGTKQFLDCKAGGRFSIRAVQNGNKNYYSSPRVSNTVLIVGSNPSIDPILTIKQGEEGTVKTQVSKGSVYTFTIAPNSGWKIHSVSFNNSDVTSQLNSDKAFTTPAINSDATLIVVYEKGDDSAVNALRKSAVKIQGMSFGIRVSDANSDDVIRVYSADGTLQKSVKAEGHITDIPLSKDKVYIVKVGGKTVKLSL